MISVLVVHYGRPDLLRACLATVKSASEVVVVDNGSLDAVEAAELSRALPLGSLALLGQTTGALQLP